MAKRALGTLTRIIEDGLAALKKSDRNKINLNQLVAEHSANVDRSYQEAEPNENRWDYFIGVRRKRRYSPVYVEVHKVTSDEVDLLIRKVTWLKGKIQEEDWPRGDEFPFFVAGSNLLLPHSPYLRQLSDHGLLVISKGTK